MIVPDEGLQVEDDLLPRPDPLPVHGRPHPRLPAEKPEPETTLHGLHREVEVEVEVTGGRVAAADGELVRVRLRDRRGPGHVGPEPVRPVPEPVHAAEVEVDPGEEALLPLVDVLVVALALLVADGVVLVREIREITRTPAEVGVYPLVDGAQNRIHGREAVRIDPDRRFPAPPRFDVRLAGFPPEKDAGEEVKFSNQSVFPISRAK